MLKKKKFIILLSLVLLLGGCGSKSSTKTASTASQNTSNKTQSISSTTKSSGDNTSSTETSEQSSTSTASTSSSANQSSEGQALLKKLYEKSKTGNIPNCNFSTNGTTIQTVEKTWGKADKTSTAGKDTYYIYNKYGVVFGVTKDSKIFNIRLYGKNFNEIRYDDMEETLGKPSQISHYKGEVTVIYNVNKEFQFMLIFYEPDDNNPNPELQYISVTKL